MAALFVKAGAEIYSILQNSLSQCLQTQSLLQPQRFECVITGCRVIDDHMTLCKQELVC